MGRLTDYGTKGVAFIKGLRPCGIPNDCNDIIYQAVDKLARYEDAEEQGRIVVLPEPTPDIDFMQLFNLAMADVEDRAIILPCKVGDTIYYIKTLQNGDDTKVIEQDTVKRIILDGIDNQIVISYGHAFMMCDFNRLLFLSREEAEKTLEGMK